MKQQLNKEYIKFLVIGFAAFIIDFSTLNILVYVFHFRTQLFNFVLVANLLSTIVAIIFGFYFQKHWTFKKGSYEQIHRELIGYVTLQLFNIVVYNSLVFNTFVNIFNVTIPASKIIVAAIQTITSYLAMKFLIFPKSAAVVVETPVK